MCYENSMLSFSKIILLLAILHRVVAEECKTDSSDNFDRALHRKLLCNYDKFQRPVKHHSTTINLTIGMALRTLQTTYDRASLDTLELGAWLSLGWRDEYLTWDPELYGGIYETNIHSSKIWTPDIAVYSSDTVDVVAITNHCTLYNEGELACVEQVKHTTLCTKDYKQWPFDSQHCTLTYGSWMNYGEVINLTSQWGNTVDLEDYHESKYWKIESINVSDNILKFDDYPNDTFPNVKFDLLIKRHAVTLIIEYGTPVFVLMVLAVGSLCLNMSSVERIILMLVNTCLHINYIHTISYVAPAVGDEVPDAVLYFRDALLLSCFILIHGVATRAIIKKHTPVPDWIIDITGIIDSKAGRIVFYEFDPDLSPMKLTDDVENQSSRNRETSYASDWKRFALFLNRLFIIFVILFYAYITIRYLA